MSRILALLGLAGALGGCSWLGNLFTQEVPVEPPAELQDFTPELDVSDLWSEGLDGGSGVRLLRLVPAVSGDRLYTVNAHGVLRALDAREGDELWSVETGLPATAGPVIDGDRIWFGTAEGGLEARSVADGARVWHRQLSSEILAPPRIAGDRVLVRTVDGRLHALERETGRQLWVHGEQVPALSLRGNARPLALGDRALAGFDNGMAAAFGLDRGKRIWEQRIAQPRGRSELERMVDVDADPVGDDGQVFFSAYQGRLSALDPRSGELLWTRTLPSYAGMSLHERLLLLTDQHSEVWAVDRRNGASLWKQAELRGRQLTRPVVQGDAVVVGDFEGYLHWLSLSDGHLVGRIQAVDAAINNPPVVVGDRVYVLGADGVLAAIRVSRRGG